MSPRQIAEQYRAENSDLPPGGFVLIYRGRADGWAADITEVHRWVAGVMAVPQYHNSPMFMAAGGDYQHGATRWERMDAKYEPV